MKIEGFTKTGISLGDGTMKAYDALICSTGADISFNPVFPIITNGIDLQKPWVPDGETGFPDTYLGIAVPKFPNLFPSLGPTLQV